MANRELAKTARILDYDTEFVVQSATRSETFEEQPNTSTSDVLAVSASKFRPAKKRSHQSSGQQLNSSGKNQRSGAHNNSFHGIPAKRQNVGGQGNGSQFNRPGKRHRCSRCDRPANNGKQCSALNKNCRRCGKLGHFEACCRKKITVDQDFQQSPMKPDEEDQQV
ncbi:uncharacterized protein LOC110679389 [Aedes aegypti]|uniref:Uncharacterized protein n=1 Tax=Aedes aegypti TaxID=7159 RepID=A0A6I8U8V6_AEDAE|nr:uncharacterized protein LOC110679389 [Aedes aegypti]